MRTRKGREEEDEGKGLEENERERRGNRWRNKKGGKERF